MDLTDLDYNIYLRAGQLVVVCLSLNVLLCAIYFRKLEVPLQRLSIFLLFNWIIEVAARICAYSDINNLPLLHLYTLGEFILFLWFYKSLFVRLEIFQKAFRPFAVIGTVLIVLNSVFIQNIYAFNPLAKTLVQLTIIALAVLYFYNLNSLQSSASGIYKSLRLINSAVLIYYSGSLFIFMCNQLFIDASEVYEIIWAFNAVLNLIFQLLVLWGLWIVVFKKAPSSS
ncbi:MAG: hypothetical protein AAF990_18515 [Bacteroidota bacterium]